MRCEQVEQMLPNAPASVARIACVLAEQAPITMKGLQDASGLGRRTVYNAVQRLAGMGVLCRRASLADTRQSYFWLDDNAIRSLGPFATTGALPGASHL